MANVKSVIIVGKVPFDCHNHGEMRAMLGDMNAPTAGLRIAYEGPAGFVPNIHGGRTEMIRFAIRGEEAVSFKYLRRMVDAITDCGGTIDAAFANDLEDSGISAINLLKVDPVKGLS